MASDDISIIKKRIEEFIKKTDELQMKTNLELNEINNSF